MGKAKDDSATYAERAASGARLQNAMRPRVEIFENATGISLLADLPGVSSEQLKLQVDKDSLLIEATTNLEIPAGMQSLHAEVRSQSYRRAFALSSELDPDGITASLKDGVLDLHIPKRAEVRPRRIEIRAG